MADGQFGKMENTTMGASVPNEQTRAYIYRILAAAGAVAAGAGVITGDNLVLWLGLAAAVLNIMPAMNTTTKKDE